MAGPGAPLGNKNAAGSDRGEPWRRALDRALAHKKGSRDDGLFVIAQQVVDMAMDGNMFAIQEIANRQDGKPHQSIAAALSGDLTVVRELFGTKPDAT